MIIVPNTNTTFDCGTMYIQNNAIGPKDYYNMLVQSMQEFGKIMEVESIQYIPLESLGMSIKKGLGTKGCP